MRRFIYAGTTAALLAVAVVSCKKSATVSVDPTLVTADEKALVASAGFNENWVEKTSDGAYLVEGDILLTKTQLNEMAGATPG